MIKDINFDLVGNLILKLRETYGLSQQQFAEEIGVSKGAVCQWEKGMPFKTENLYDVARYFNITVSELIEGQLDEEDQDYFERNYNLDDFDNFDEINESNYDDLLEYFKRCKNVIKRFMMLYPIHVQGKLTKKQSNEYNRLSRYFDVDYEYANAINIGMSIPSIDEAVEELTNFFEITDKKDLDYILFKLFYLKLKVRPISVLNYDKDNSATNEYLELIGKERCDELLTNFVNKATDDEIENSLPIRRLIEAGARCFFTPEHIHGYEYNEVDEDVFKQLTNIAPNAIIQDRYDFFNKERYTNQILERYNPYSWKNYMKEGYEYLIDVETTNKIRDIVILKNSDPNTFYKNLISRDLKHLEAK